MKRAFFKELGGNLEIMYHRPVWMGRHCARSAVLKEMRQSLLCTVCNLKTQIKSQRSRTYKQVSPVVICYL